MVGNLITNLIPEFAEKFFMKPAPFQIYRFKVSKNSTVVAILDIGVVHFRHWLRRSNNQKISIGLGRLEEILEGSDTISLKIL